MWTAILQETFRFLSGRDALGAIPEEQEAYCRACVGKAAERLVEDTYPRVRALPDHIERLRAPVERSLRYIDALVERIPGAVLCSRSAYVSDPRVNAFFAGPIQIQEVFSQSQEVRDLFDANPGADECWALLCMRKSERSQLGMALVGNEVRKEVMQTGVNFSDHQVVSPGATEPDARQALKCCIFNSLVAFIRARMTHEKEERAKLESRRRSLESRLRTLRARAGAADQSALATLDGQLAEVLGALAHRPVRLDSIEEHLTYMIHVLERPKDYVSHQDLDLRLSRLGVKLDAGAEEEGYQVALQEIRVSCHRPRIAALVRFPRAELLPQEDFLRKADLFLAV